MTKNASVVQCKNQVYLNFGILSEHVHTENF